MTRVAASLVAVVEGAETERGLNAGENMAPCGVLFAEGEEEEGKGEGRRGGKGWGVVVIVMEEMVVAVTVVTGVVEVPDVDVDGVWEGGTGCSWRGQGDTLSERGSSSW